MQYLSGVGAGACTPTSGLTHPAWRVALKKTVGPKFTTVGSRPTPEVADSPIVEGYIMYSPMKISLGSPFFWAARVLECT